MAGGAAATLVIGAESDTTAPVAGHSIPFFGRCCATTGTLDAAQAVEVLRLAVASVLERVVSDRPGATQF